MSGIVLTVPSGGSGHPGAAPPTGWTKHRPSSAIKNFRRRKALGLTFPQPIVMSTRDAFVASLPHI